MPENWIDLRRREAWALIRKGGFAARSAAPS